MAFRKTLVHRLLSTIPKPIRPSPPSSKPPGPTLLERILSKSDDGDGLFRRFLHQNNGAIAKPSSSSSSSRLHTIPVGDKLIEKLKGMNGERIRLDALAPPRIPPDREEEGEKRGRITVEEVRKVLKVSQMEEVKARLREVKEPSISYSDFIQICRGGGGGDGGAGSFEYGLRVAKQMDESGAVLVLGNIVFLKPEMVARAIESVIPVSLATTTSTTKKEQELQALEEEKTLIDRAAVAAVKKELWGGLGFLVVQTLGFMRLTFWELSWDVMEPICFYVTSVYFMAGYAFFLRTSKDPSFEGFFESRFSSRQKRLMERRNFDLDKFLQLRRELGRSSSSPTTPCLEFDTCGNAAASSSSSVNYCGCHRRDVLGLVQ